MDENKLRQLLQLDLSAKPRRGWRCPDDNLLAAYATGNTDANKRTAFELHTADCGYCREAIAFLAQTADWPPPTAVPGAALARAGGLVQVKPPLVWRWRWAMATAATAAIIVVVGFVALRWRGSESNRSDQPLVAQQHQPEAPVVVTTPTIEPRPAPTALQLKPAGREEPMLRGASDNQKPAIVFPREGVVLTRRGLQFRWTGVPGALFYEVKVVTADATLVLETRTTEPKFLPTDEMVLETNAKYFVTIVAHLPHGPTERSVPVSFRLSK